MALNIKSSFVTVTPVMVENITLSANHMSMALDETYKLTATVTPENAENQTLEWEIPDNEVLLTQLVNNKNLNIGAAGEGTVTITVRATDGSGVSASCEVFVSANTPVKTLTLSPETLNLYVGYSEQLNAIITPQDAYTQELRWMSSNENVVTVNSNGLVTARGVGNATITAITTDGSNLSATCAVSVTTVPVESVTLNRTELEMNEGSSYTLSATVLPSDAYDRSLTWTSSNPSVATVNYNGRVTAVGIGSTIVTATTNDGTNISAACHVTVKSQMANDCFVIPDTEVLYVDIHLQYQLSSSSEFEWSPWYYYLLGSKSASQSWPQIPVLSSMQIVMLRAYPDLMSNGNIIGNRVLLTNSYDASRHVLTCSNGRFGTENQPTQEYVNAVGIIPGFWGRPSYDYYRPSVPMGFWKFPNPDIFPNTTLSDMRVGTGDGVKVDFTPPLNLWVKDTERVFVDGVLQVRDVDYTCDHRNNLSELYSLNPSIFCDLKNELVRQDSTATSGMGFHPLKGGCNDVASGSNNERRIYIGTGAGPADRNRGRLLPDERHPEHRRQLLALCDLHPQLFRGRRDLDRRGVLHGHEQQQRRCVLSVCVPGDDHGSSLAAQHGCFRLLGCGPEWTLLLGRHKLSPQERCSDSLHPCSGRRSHHHDDSGH